jgi:maltodextrin utilization protein YvdJ
VFWVTHDSVVGLGSDGELRVVKLGKINATLDAAHLRTELSSVAPYFATVAPVAVLMIFIGMLLSFVAMLVYLLFDALFVFLLGKLLKQSWSYREAYHISLHAVTLPLLLSSIFFLMPVAAIQLPFLSSFVLLAVVYINFTAGEKVDTEKHE